MERSENDAYILGTDDDELYRLGLQHYVWAEEAHKGWANANFTAGQILLDLGCGPGFCTKELAFITGPTGKVIGVDKSKMFLDYLSNSINLKGLNIELVHADFNAMKLADSSLDGMYCRWSLAWISNPGEILQKVMSALKPGGKMVIQEYYNWSTHQIEPDKECLSKAIAAALKSFKDSEGEIDIGRYLPKILTNIGMRVTQLRLMSKIAIPTNFSWQWPLSFYKNYFPRLAQLGYLSQTDVITALREVQELANEPGAVICCPLMVEVIAEKK